MEFARIGNGLEIVLSLRDSQRLGLAFDTFDFSDEKQRSVLWELVDAARVETGFDTPSSHLSVHLHATREGGMRFCLTRMRQKLFAYRFFSFDALCRAKEAGALKSLEGTLYMKDGAFFLLCPHRARALSEFAAPFTLVHKAALTEGAKRLDASFLSG
ncbi:MAG: hypothetical protein IKT43_02720 [Clostridia bacterium]|nr:hypothetical protein [Clostridia bacterium]